MARLSTNEPGFGPTDDSQLSLLQLRGAAERLKHNFIISPNLSFLHCVSSLYQCRKHLKTQGTSWWRIDTHYATVGTCKTDPHDCRIPLLHEDQSSSKQQQRGCVKMEVAIRTLPSPPPTTTKESSLANTSPRDENNNTCPFNIPTCPGCVPPKTPTSHNENLRLQHEIVFWQAMADASGLKSPQLEWAQLKQSFVSSYWSMGVMTSSKAFLHVFQWLAPQSDAMNASRDALCLIHLGVRYRDERLLLEGRTRHIAALRHTQAAISRPNAAFEDCVLGASYTLGHCEVYSVISQNGRGWTGHTGPFQRILEARGPKSIVTPFAHALLQNIRMVEVATSFLNRKASYLFSSEWIAAAKQKHDSLAFHATNMALQVGAALEKADRLCAVREQPDATIVCMLNDMMELDLALKTWLIKADRQSGGDFIPHKTVPTSTFASFYDRCGGLADVFPFAIEFPSFVSATSHIYIWTSLLLLRQAIADVSRLYSYPLLAAAHLDQEAMLNASIDECAVSLCQSVAFLSKGNHGFAGIVSCGAPLHFASECFRTRLQQKRLLWSIHVREFLQRDILLGGSHNTSLDLQKPVFTWWMLPDIFSGSVELHSLTTSPTRDVTIVEEDEKLG